MSFERPPPVRLSLLTASRPPPRVLPPWQTRGTRTRSCGCRMSSNLSPRSGVWPCPRARPLCASLAFSVPRRRARARLCVRSRRLTAAIRGLAVWWECAGIKANMEQLDKGQVRFTHPLSITEVAPGSEAEHRGIRVLRRRSQTDVACVAFAHHPVCVWPVPQGLGF